MPNRSASTEKYRYGFQGQEKDDELKGEGNSLNYTFRMHDPRVGRFFAIDPLTKKYPHYTPYSFSGNRLIDAIELEGLEETLVQNKLNTKEFNTMIQVSNMTTLGKEFKSKFLSQNKVDILYYELTDGADGRTSHVKNIEEFRKRKETTHTFDNVYENQVKDVFAKGKSLILIGISNIDPKNLDSFIKTTHTMAHEKHSHAINILNGKPAETFADHEKYNGERSYYSPDESELKRKTKVPFTPKTFAEKDYSEISTIVLQNENIREVADPNTCGKYGPGY